MVDRYKSLLGSQLMPDDIKNIRVDRIVNNNMEIISRTNEHAARMREYISKYRRDATSQADRYIGLFKKQQEYYAKDRNYLKNQVEKLEKGGKKDTPQYNFVKKELLKAVKSELELEFELNTQINNRKQQKELFKRNLIQGSVQLQNAISDIQAKKAQILYLERLINECVQLLEIIGVLVFQNGQKIDLISEKVRKANEQIEKAEKNIEKAKIDMQKSRCKFCCIIIIAAIIIVLGLVAYFGIAIR